MPRNVLDFLISVVYRCCSMQTGSCLRRSFRTNKSDETQKRLFLKELPIGVWIRLIRAYNVISNDIRRSIKKKGLTIPQLYVVVILGVLGDLHLGVLGRQMLVTKGNITPIIDHLEKDGLVRRERDTRDRRMVWVRLTALREGRYLKIS